MGEVLTRKDVAEKYKLSLRTVDYLVATKQIYFSRCGKRAVRFDSDRLDDWFKDQECKEYRRNQKK